MRASFLFLTILLFSTCSKSDDKVNKDCDTQMISKFEDQITCTEVPTNAPCIYLAKGNYKEAKIYFVNIVCATCNTVPPQNGYNCDGEKIPIENFSQTVTDVEFISPKRTE